MFLEVAEEEDDDQPCQVCGEDDNEDVLMYCDGCQKLWHTYCAGLEEVPHGHWFCDNCRAQRVVDPRPQLGSRASQASRRRTRGQQRRQRGIQQVHEQSWNDVWQSVYSQINLDLDFPYDDDEDQVAHIRRHRQRSIQNNRVAHDAFIRRMRVAELHGAGNRFRETEPTLPSNASSRLPMSRNRRPSPALAAQDPEEALAWDAFDQARAASAEPSSSRRKKRKSRTPSPAESPKESTPTVVKRRRTSHSAAPAPNNSRSSSSRARRSVRPSPTPRRVLPEPSGPSFLQSLLQEVEYSSINPNPTLGLHRPSPRNAGSPAAEQASPRPSSPAQSPLPSNHSSPRAMSASPALRPSSPTGLSSSIQPIFPTAHSEFSIRPGSPPSQDLANGDLAPTRPPAARSNEASSLPIAQPRPVHRPSRILEPISPPAPVAPPLGASSPTRATLSLTAKSDVQKLVSAALKPHYTSQAISKDQYTVINRDISRMLYDQIGDFDSLGIDDKVKWEKVAGDEVNKAVGALKAQ